MMFDASTDPAEPPVEVIISPRPALDRQEFHQSVKELVSTGEGLRQSPFDGGEIPANNLVCGSSDVGADELDAAAIAYAEALEDATSTPCSSTLPESGMNLYFGCCGD